MRLTDAAARLFTNLAGVALLLIVASTAMAQTSSLTVFVNQSKAIQIKNLKRVSVTNPRVADVVIVSPSELIVNGLQIGRTTMYLWDEKGRKEVQLAVMNDRADIPSLIRADAKRLVGTDNVEAKIIQREGKETLVLRGVVDSDTQIDIIEEVAKAYFNGTIMNLLEAQAIFESVEDQLRRMIDLPEVKVTVIYEGRQVFKRGEVPKIANIILEGFVDDQYDKDRVTAIAKSFGNVVDLIDVVNPIQVLLEAQVLELSSQNSDLLGMEWGTTVGAGEGAMGTPAPNTVNFLENLFFSWRGDENYLGPRVKASNNWPWNFENLNRLDPLYAKLNFDVQRGSAKILANPKVITRVNTQAQIRVGGQIPVPGESDAGGITIEYKTYGLEMSILPNVDHKGNITSKIDMTWTTLDRANSVQIGAALYIALRERTTKNEVTVRDGQHIIISGLIQKEEGRTLSEVPLLSKIPVLGKLFQSKSFTEGKSELVIIVTPSLLASKQMRDRFATFDEEQKAPAEADVEVASLSEITPDQAARLQMAAAEVDKAFSTILNRDELTVTPVNLPTIRINKGLSDVEVAAAGLEGGAAATVGSPARAAAPAAPASGGADFADRVRSRLQAGKAGALDLDRDRDDVARRADLERRIRDRVRESRAPEGPSPEAASLFPAETSSGDLETQLRSIITELPADGGNAAVEASGPVLAPVAPAESPREPARVAVADSAPAKGADIDSRVDRLFLQIKEKLSSGR